MQVNIEISMCMRHSTTSEAIQEPRLAPPGAGLPLIELAIARFLFDLRCRFGSRESFTQNFLNERREIAELIKSAGTLDQGRRVLIQRPIGIEDSSRNWSLLMTLDHLRIVNLEIAGIIRSLGQGTVSPGEASTADVKPSRGVGAAVVQEYADSCDEVLNAAAELGNLKTALRYTHPWFGPMDAYAWYALAGSHLGIHKVQIERILAMLRTA